jgi:hypothetical protein
MYHKNIIYQSKIKTIYYFIELLSLFVSFIIYKISVKK